MKYVCNLSQGMVVCYKLKVLVMPEILGPQLQDHFEILYIFSLRKWKKICSKMDAPARGIELLP